MAVIRYTGLVSEIRGRLNGSVLNSSKTVFTIGNSPLPSHTVSEERSLSKARFQKVQERWKLESEGDKASWAVLAANVPNRNRFGEEVILSGYNKYMEASLNAAALNTFISKPINTSPLAPPNFSELVAVSANYVEVGPGEFSFSVTVSIIGGDSSQKRIVAEVSKPISAGVTSFQGQYRLVGLTATNIANGNVPITAETWPVSWRYTQGDRVAVRVSSYLLGRGLYNYTREFFVRVGQAPIISLFVSNKYSGSAPYVYSIGIDNKSLVNGVDYRLECRSVTSSSGCPLPATTGARYGSMENALMTTGSFTESSSVNPGSCRSVTALIKRLSDDAIISIQSFHINNI